MISKQKKQQASTKILKKYIPEGNKLYVRYSTQTACVGSAVAIVCSIELIIPNIAFASLVPSIDVDVVPSIDVDVVAADLDLDLVADLVVVVVDDGTRGGDADMMPPLLCAEGDTVVDDAAGDEDAPHVDGEEDLNVDVDVKLDVKLNVDAAVDADAAGTNEDMGAAAAAAAVG